MVASPPHSLEIKHPINLAGAPFINNKLEHYAWLRENAPVYRGRIYILRPYFVSRYDDCVFVLKDPRFLRDRRKATGGKNRLPFPLPKSLQFLAQSMIIEDDPEHRRLRTLVHKAFVPRQLAKLESRIESLAHDLIDDMQAKGTADLMPEFALPIPVTVISEMLGVSAHDLPQFTNYMDSMTSGLSGLGFFKALMWDLPSATKYVRELINQKRKNPGDDILTGLIEAEEEGERLTEDELISMVFLLIVAGYETTVHLITNGVFTLLQHPDQLSRLRDDRSLMDSAVEEILRFNGPIHGTKPVYPTEDVTLHGETIPKGSTVMPLLGAANFDPDVFEDPNTFDIARSPNRHLGFGQGIHYCLGAPLARMEAKIAFNVLLDRSPDLKFAVDPEELKLQSVPGWHRFKSMPIQL